MLYAVLSVLSQIYCNGPILRTVQDAYLFTDSKHFVDMSLKYDPVSTLREFDLLGDSVNDPLVLKEFVSQHFNPPGTELMEWNPHDYVDFPSNFLNIQDYHHRRWALHLHRIWKELCRKVKDDVRHNQDRYSLLYVPYPFIIPGGRFREFYYWDTFWILKGLLFSEMYDTAQGVIKNLAYMVDNNGFVPNGGRVYYLSRSQPPLLIPMVYDYYLATGNLDFMLEILPTLEREYNFWVDKRSTNVLDEEGNIKYPYYQYKTKQVVPRPESYREDKELVQGLPDEEKVRVWSEIASAAETGWDFSTRWFAQTGDLKHHMESIRTWSIIPVDLNAFLCANSRILANLFEIQGNTEKRKMYMERYKWAKRQMMEIHWNQTDGVWYDFDIETKKHSNTYYVSNAVPLYAKCFDDDEDIIPHRVHEYLKREGVMNFTKGLPTSLAMGSEQQWDKDNAWPPMIHMVIEGFRTTGDKVLMQVAEKMATSWLTVTYRSFIRTHAMFEKYNVTQHSDEPGAGGGGEYEVQKGFGWTNGVILDLLDKYGDKLTVTGESSSSNTRLALGNIFSFFITLIAFYIF
ncbi:unnamed protein product [Auanema sp. JU1783]|nr:unnamed protein product [Auanema sp. JU1783]